MDYLIGVSGTIKIKQKRGFLSFNERSVFHKVAIVSAGTSPCLASSSVQVEVGVSLCLGCGGGERMQRKEKDQVSGGPGALEAQGNCVGTTGAGLWQRVPSACCTSYRVSSSWKIQEQVWIPQGKLCGSCVLSVAPTRSNAVLSLDLRCLNQLQLEAASQH